MPEQRTPSRCRSAAGTSGSRWCSPPGAPRRAPRSPRSCRPGRARRPRCPDASRRAGYA
jgi:hypothetical protein